MPPTHNPFRFEAAILSRMRSPVTSRSNWAKERSTFRVSRPIEVVVLNCWVTETNETPWASNSSTSLAKSASERVSRSTLYDHNLNFPGPDIGQELLERRAVGRAAGIAAVGIAGPDQGPAFRRLAAHIGFGGVMLGIERVEILLQPMIGGDPGIDGAANPLGGPMAHDCPSASMRPRRPKKRGPDHRVPVMAKATLERLR